MQVNAIAAWLSLPCEGDAAVEVLRAAPLESAAPDEISFVGARKAQREAEASRAGCLIVPEDFENTAGRTVIRTKDPRAAFGKVVARLHPVLRPAPGVQLTACVAASAELGAEVSIGPFAVISDGARIGAGAVIGAHCFVGEQCVVGEQCTLHPRVTLYERVEIGARSILHSGCVIGADGYGFNRTPQGYEKFPQIGRVVIGCDVELGANCTVDRAALGVTRIGDGTKFDDMVHIGHNCDVGKHVLIVAQTGVGGGSVIEDWCVIGGQVGIGDNVRIKSGAVLGSKSGVLTGKVVAGGGQVYWGVPARPLKQYLEVLAVQNRLPEIKAVLDALRGRSGKHE